ncbi:MAG: DUF4250 domain-containing protein [Candidatus Izemoplasmataceae bacterium]|jgi:hypothetical protein|uniref:DUF4250 domain-containing protein n=1 Tax=Liberiplasma polymorphum TaxID=3374570 RepID=UPI00377375A0
MINLSITPEVLLSLVNTKLRNDFRSLDVMCEELELDQHELEKRLSDIGYVYSDKNNQFIFKKEGL